MKQLFLTITFAAAVASRAELRAQSVSAEPVAATERAFAAYTARVGMRDGFLRYIARNGILFRPQATNGYDALMKQKSGTNGVLLEWKPIYVDISGSGDYAISTGPWTRKKAGDPNTLYGDFFTVWRKQDDGTWKFVVDQGISYKGPNPVRKLVVRSRPRVSTKADANVVRDEIHKIDAQISARSGRLPVSPDLRVLREGKLPFVGEAAAKQLASEAVVITQPLGSHSSSAGDLGYTFGDYQRGNEKGSYVRVFRREGNALRLIVDVEVPS